MKRINHTSSGENLIGILLSISIGIGLILFSSGRTNAHSSEIAPHISFISSRIRVQQIYTSQIGIREKYPNSGPDVQKYLNYVGLSKGNPWCAAFVCWVFGQAGVENPRSGWSLALFGQDRVIWSREEQRTWNKEQRLPPSVPIGFSPNTSHINRTAIRCAYPPGAASEWLQPAGGSGVGSNSSFPTTADIFGLYFPEKKRIAHVGFIDEWDGTWMISVEGNTNVSGSREGDGVYRKRRLVKTVYKVARYVGR
ncbi:MAG: hypothetical protein WBJ10_14635 [Daejeonella sp.]|uniref:hypothetical protein n=1 Tax=Daejeonella sp. TaxID=2805397 RepID=UPI003C76BF34